MIDFLLGEYLPWIISAVGALFAVVVSYVAGRRRQKDKQKQEAWERMFKDEKAKTKAADAVLEEKKKVVGATPSDLVKRLRSRDAKWK